MTKSGPPPEPPSVFESECSKARVILNANIAARLVKLVSTANQQNTLFWTVLDRATQIPRAHSLVHSGQVCPDTHSLWVPVQLWPV